MHNRRLGGLPNANRAPKGRTYWTASADGSIAIFLTGSDLYEAAIEEDAEGRLLVHTNLIAHGVPGKLGVSEDARRVYFASDATLGAETVSQGKSPVPGKPNLYLYDASKSGAARYAFIGTLAGADLAGNETDGALASGPALQTARVSPDGLHAAFDSWAPLTGYDNTDVSSGEADSEVFLYDATANEGKGSLVCASCNPSGARPRGSGNGGGKQWFAGTIPRRA